MRYTGLIGYPLGHSLSAVFQQAALDYYGLEMRYELWETPGDELAAAVDTLRQTDYCGANVTIPHKEAVMPLLDELDETARNIGAVNTIVNSGGRLTGCNTDVAGFIRGLREDAGFTIEGKHAILLGAGGVAKAAAYGLVTGGISSLIVLNRSFPRAQALVSSLAQHALTNRIPVKISAAPLTADSAARVLPSCNLIVNGTSVGMRHSLLENESPLPSASIPKDVLVYDLVYNPVETPLLRQARSSGAETLGGLPMLIYQGAAAFELWTGEKSPVDIMMKAAEKALVGRQE